mgnify:CR=1 FL=1
MFLYYLIYNLLDFFLNNIYFPLSLLLLIIIYHFFMYILRDPVYLHAIKRYNDPENISLIDLDSKPLINFIVPAWNEKKHLRKCLKSLIDLNYPTIKVIVNAGGDDGTLQIARDFKKNNNFVILHQKKGKKSAALGKIKAINECLNHIEKGLIYIIDADCYITDEILLRIIYPIINKGENVVISHYRPLEEQEEKDFIKYLQISKIGSFTKKFSRYHETSVSGANTCINFKVLKDIGTFTDDRIIAEDISRGMDINNKGYKFFTLVDYRGKIFSDYPENLTEYSDQRKRYFQNRLVLARIEKNRLYYFKFVFIMFSSLYVIITPFFLFISFNLFLIAILFILFQYLIKIRRYFFFKNVINSKHQLTYKISFFIKIAAYLFIEKIIDIINLPNIIKYFLANYHIK